MCKKKEQCILSQASRFNDPSPDPDDLDVDEIVEDMLQAEEEEAAAGFTHARGRN